MRFFQNVIHERDAFMSYDTNIIRKIVLATALCTQLCFGLSVVSYTTDSDGITFTLNTGKMKVNIYQDDIIRVTYTPMATFPAKTSLCVIKTWPTPSFTATEEGDTITIQTSRIKAKVCRSTAKISYSDLTNSPILSEYDKSMTAVTVEGVPTYTCNTTFNSPTNEGLFGLGQHMIDGKYGTTIVNYKGLNELMDQDYTTEHFYSVIPLMVSTRGYGLFWDNYSLSNFYGGEGNNTRYRYSSECGDLIDYYFFYGPELDNVIALYRSTTGRVPLLSKWSYGLIQSKDKYQSQSEYLAVKDGYRNNNIPVDCIVQDWGYWEPNPWGSHIFNASKYPDPKAMVDQMHKANIHTMVSVWPCFAPGSNNYTELNNLGALWPVTSGKTRFVDAYSSKGREAYWNQLKSQILVKYGFDSWWNDNNEPYPYPDKFNRHAITTAMGKGAFYYNTYPLMLSTTGYTNWRRDIPGKRVSILARCSFAGQQRTGAISWNNDISCTWGSFSNSIPAGLHFSLSGNPYWCTDIGGYWGHSLNWATADNRELFTRWFQYGAFCSIFRIHGGGSRELYCSNWDRTTKANLLKIDQLRYRLMPYIYSLGWKVTNEDYTIQRHLVMDFRNDPHVYNIGNQFMFGPAILVSPVVTQRATSRSLYLPAGKWYDFWTGDSTYTTTGKTINVQAPLNKIPLHIRAGSIIPMGPIIQYATQRSDSIELRVYPGADGSFTLYEDEGDGYNYERGEHALIPVMYNNGTGKVTIGVRSGSFTGMKPDKVFSIVFVKSGHGVDLGKTANPDCIVNYTGDAVTACPATGSIISEAKRTVLHPPITLKTMQNKIGLPFEFKGKPKEVVLYNCSGRLLRKIITRKQVVNISKDFRLPPGLYIVKARVLIDK